MPAIATPRQAPAIASSERNSGRRVSDGRDRCSLFIMHSSSRKQAISFRPMQILSRAASCRSRGSAVSSIEVAREPCRGVAHPKRVHGALLLRLPLCRRRYSNRLVDDAFGIANGEQATSATPVLPPPDLSCTVHFHRVELMS